MNRSQRLAGVVLAAILLASCAGQSTRWTPDYHTVRSGETLYSIAAQYKLDYRQLAAWNRLSDAAVIYPGQQLLLQPASGGPAGTAGGAPGRTTSVPTAEERRGWQWPTAGPVELSFGQSPKTESGVRIGGREGQPVLAAADGVVVYSGSGLKGYGQLLVIKHNAIFLSAYGNNAELLVIEGQQLKRGQQVARMGHDSAGRPGLHFEIRRNGDAVDPLLYLPAR